MQVTGEDILTLFRRRRHFSSFWRQLFAFALAEILQQRRMPYISTHIPGGTNSVRIQAPNRGFRCAGVQGNKHA